MTIFFQTLPTYSTESVSREILTLFILKEAVNYAELRTSSIRTKDFYQAFKVCSCLSTEKLHEQGEKGH